MMNRNNFTFIWI